MLRTQPLLEFPERELLCESYEVRLIVDYILNVVEQRCQDDPGGGPVIAIGIDTETTGLHQIHDRIILFSFYTDLRYTIPALGYDDYDCAFTVFGPLLNRPENLELFRPILEHPRIIKCGANFNGFDWFMFRNHGIIVADPIHDTVVMSWLYDENFTGQHGLKACARRFWKIHMRDYTSEGDGEMDIRNWPLEKMIRYPADDAYMSFAEHSFLSDRLRAFDMHISGRTAWTFYTDFMVDAQRVLRNMMARGVQIDLDYLNSLAPDILHEIDEIEREFNTAWIMLQDEKQVRYITEAENLADDKRLAKGRPTKFKGRLRLINLQSTPMLRFMFFTLLEHEVLKWTKPGQNSGEQNPSLDKETLTEYSDQGCEYAELLLRHRELSKLYGTYIGDEPDDEEYHGKKAEQGGLRRKAVGGRIYTNFKFGPVTGRLASSGPNLQNIPIRTPLGKKIRQAFIAPYEWLLLDSDYSQLEMKLFASAAEEELMLNAIRSGLDIHCTSAALMYNLKYEDVLAAKKREDAKLPLSDDDHHLLDLRQAAKTLGFGILYGMGPRKLAQKLRIEYALAKEYVDRFLSAYPNMRSWIHTVHAECEVNGVVWTYFNRPRRLYGIRNTHVDWIRARMLRQSLNSIIQGSAADVVLRAMVMVEDDPLLHELNCRLLLQVHDELMFEVPERNAETAAVRVRELMECEPDWFIKVPLTVSCHIGKSWAEAH